MNEQKIIDEYYRENDTTYIASLERELAGYKNGPAVRNLRVPSASGAGGEMAADGDVHEVPSPDCRGDVQA